jgi:hypothetical protein
MVSNEKRWKVLLFTCLGLAVGAAFCMKWMEGDLQVGGQKFTIIGLELFYDVKEMTRILSGINETVRIVLSYHLYFDFAFMAGIFPFIASLCMLASHRTNNRRIRNALVILGSCQLVAWGLDIFENSRLLLWMKEPSITENELRIFHLAVAAKWIISVTGIILASGVLLLRKKAILAN